MPNFDSPLGSKRFTGQQMREFDVPDGEDPIPQAPSRQRLGGFQSQAPDLSDAFTFQQQMEQETPDEVAAIEREMRAAKDARRLGKTRLNEGAVRRIEMLLNMTRTTRDFEIGGHKYALQTLSSEEMRAAILSASQFDGTVQSPFEVRRQFLAYSLTMVASLDIVQFVGSNDFEAKLALIDRLDEALLNRLYDEYLEMVREAREKYSIKNNEDAEGVVEDLKK